MGHKSIKLAPLMALIVASRMVEVQALDLRFCVYKPSGVSYRLPSITKTQKTGSPPKESVHSRIGTFNA